MTGSPSFNADLLQRSAALSEKPIDVVIIGAGINGAGLFRDLSLQGVNCLIVDKSDFGCGTSAASSRLIHGGLKYLETGEFGLVAQSTLERNLLLKNAAHTVTPLLTIIPIFSWVKGIGAAIGTFFGAKTLARSRGALLIKLGLLLYDFYGARQRVLPLHQMLSRKSILDDIPALTPKIKAAATYYDAAVNKPERMVWELIKDGLDANSNSVALNYCQLVSSADGKLSFLPQAGQRLEVSPRIVVNAAGPWIDQVNAELGFQSHYIGGTKGSHMLLDHPELVLALKGRMLYFEADDGRICLVYDYNGLALVGSTDAKAHDTEQVHCEDWEIDYFFTMLGALLPGMAITRDQIVYTFSGIRPLPWSDASNPGLISRDHSAPTLEAEAGRPFPLMSMVGGKWTTFRGFAEEVTDTILQRLERPRVQSTKELQIGGGKDFPRDRQARSQWLQRSEQSTGLSQTRLDELLTRYGTTALHIAQHQCQWTDADRLPDAGSYSLLELDWIMQHEAVTSLADLTLRRTTLAMSARMSRADIEKLAELLGARLGWTATDTEREIQILVDQLAQRHCRVR